MRVPQSFLSKDHTLAIGDAGRWACLGPGYVVGNTQDFRSMHAITDTGKKELNKQDRLECAFTQSSEIDVPAFRQGDDAVSVVVSVDDLKMLMDFCYDDDTRYYANGIAFLTGCVVASDALTLCIVDAPVIVKDGFCGIVPRLFLKKLLAALPRSATTVRFCVDSDHGNVRASTSGIYGMSRLIAGTFPPFDSAKPKQINSIVDVNWTSDTDLALSRAGNRIISSCSFGIDDPAFRVNGDLFKTCLKHGGATVQFESADRPMQWTREGVTILCVPARF